jgi:AcrR family transcriptional regulator
MRRTQEEAEATRQAVLAAALFLFRERGYATTRLSDVAKAANVTRGAIYHHFDNKAHLYRTLLHSFAQVFSEQVAAAIQEGGSFLQICQRVMVNPLVYLEQNQEFAAFYELVQFHTADIPELHEAYSQQEAQAGVMLESIADYFHTGIQQGIVRTNLDPHELARTFVSLQNGLIHLWLVRKRSFALAEAAVTAATVFVSGIALPEGA